MNNKNIQYNPREVLGEELLNLGKQNNNIVVVSCDSANGGFNKFIKAFPDRYIECGIAEQSAVGVCSGLAKMGYIPFLMAITPFITMRNYEQIRDNLGYSNMNVKLIGTGAGLAYSTLGYTHEAVEDIALMQTIKNITIFAPGDNFEVKESLKLAISIDGPVYIRMAIHPFAMNKVEEQREFRIGHLEELIKGTDAVIIAYGTSVNEALRSSEILKKEGISLAVMEVNTIKPLDKIRIIELARMFPVVFTLEEHSVIGGLGSSIAALLSSNKNCAPLYSLGVMENDTIVTGPYREVLDHYGLSGEKVAKYIHNVLKGLKRTWS